ncbi:uncharacterized protein LOC135122861 isoform X5 [Zophobas morio]|uniref:uncharacterized protein LOC135122861 isoform X5 n=1 Tax=Zophobas morio TaxID=2755281 RepID=UPI0030827D34
MALEEFTGFFAHPWTLSAILRALVRYDGAPKDDQAPKHLSRKCGECTWCGHLQKYYRQGAGTAGISSASVGRCWHSCPRQHAIKLTGPNR